MFEGINFNLNQLSQHPEIFVLDFLNVIQPILLLALGIAFYGFLVWYFYHYLAKRDIIRLNLSPYEHRVTRKLFAILSYILTYLIAFPVISFIWFSVLATLLFILAKSLPVENILLVSIAIVSSARIAAYYNETMAQEITKLLPYVMLGVVLIEPAFFSVDLFVQRLIEIPIFLPRLPYFIVFLMLLELFLKLMRQLKVFVFGELSEVNTQEVVKEQVHDLLFIAELQKDMLRRLEKLEQKPKN